MSKKQTSQETQQDGPTLEARLKRLEEIVEALDSEDLEL
jgi:exonuclease VII small subunit